jgi:hypothetical protein
MNLDGPGRNRFNRDVLFPELRGTQTVRRQIYHDQAHCFCSAGAPRPRARRHGVVAAPRGRPFKTSTRSVVSRSDQAQGIGCSTRDQARANGPVSQPRQVGG